MLGLIVTIAASLVIGTPAVGAAPAKVLFDADPGIDDSMAILFALLSPEIEVVGISTVYGNATIDNATANALTLVELVGASVPVARGAGHPLVNPQREPRAYQTQGASLMANRLHSSTGVGLPR